MNQASNPGAAPLEEPAPTARPQPGEPHANWREALMALVATRIALIQLESQDAAKEAGRRAALISAACGCAFFAWALILAGGISLVAQATGAPWSLIALATAALHLLAGVILAKMAKPSDGTAFPITRAEFQKDREWIENFNKTKKSND